MLSGRQLLAAAGLVLAIAACERTITGPTVYVDRPVPRADTVIVTRPDTVVVQRPETSFVQLPGRVDTVVVTRPDTVVRIDTLRVVTHDTLIVRDTVVHVDTLIRERIASAICVVVRTATDTLYAQYHDAPCDLASLRLEYPTPPIVFVDTNLTVVVGERLQLLPTLRYTVRYTSAH